VQHLLHKSQFDAVLGTRSALTQVTRTEHFFAHRLAFSPATAELFQPDSDFFVGVMSAKRFAKRAVTRNLIKRQIYALTQTAPLEPAAYVVRLRTAIPRDRFPSASSNALKCLVRAELQELLKPFLVSPSPIAS
jgi:ribonuclease P protein component